MNFVSESIRCFNISFPDVRSSWCYSAKQLQNELASLLLGQKLLHIFVPAYEYIESMQEYGCYKNRILNFSFIGGGVTLVFENTVLDLGVHAEGMLQYRVFKTTDLKYEETVCSEEELKCSYYDSYYFSVTDSPIAFRFENKQLVKIRVEGTAYYCFELEGFDCVTAKEAGKAHDLPVQIVLLLSNTTTIKIIGDDMEYFYMEFRAQ